MKKTSASWEGTTMPSRTETKCFLCRRSPAADSELTRLRRKLPGLNDRTQNIRLRFIPHQVRIHFPAVIIQLVDFVVVSILDQQFERGRTVFGGLQCIAEHVIGVFAAVNADNFHSRPNPGLGSWHSFECVCNGAIFLQP